MGRKCNLMEYKPPLMLLDRYVKSEYQATPTKEQRHGTYKLPLKFLPRTDMFSQAQ